MIISLTLAVVAVVGIVLSVKFLKPTKTAAASSEYIRIHIRANSNSEQDQNVKYKVKEAIVELLTPIVASSNTQNEAKIALGSALDDICKVADRVLAENGFNYTSCAYIRKEQFPTRSYGDTTLEAGEYEALIIELGTGTGDNWWCVMFPPLCLVGSESNGQNVVKYKSKIYELIRKYCRKC